MPAIDAFDDNIIGLTSPIVAGFDITPSDTADIAQVARAVMVSGEGDVAAVLADGDTLVLPALAPGVVYPFRIARVLSTGTTATGLKGLV